MGNNIYKILRAMLARLASCNLLCRIFQILILCLILASCDSKDCVEADDWGYPKILVTASYDKDSIKGDGLTGPQKVHAIDSGQIIIDAHKIPIVMTMSSDNQWTSWFGNNGDMLMPDGTVISPDWDPLSMVPDKECQYKVNSSRTGYARDTVNNYDIEVHDARQRNNNDPRPEISKARRYIGETQGTSNQLDCPAPGVVFKNPDKYADCRVPCYMRDGMGLYVGLANMNGGEDDIVITRHIPDAKFPEVPYSINKTKAQNLGSPVVGADGKLVINSKGDIAYGQAKDGYLIRGIPADEIPGAQTNDRVYFKILDYFYPDNHGYYKVNIKEGTRSPNPGPIESIITYLTTPAISAMHTIWEGLTQQAEFLNLIRSAMYLYIVFFSYAFMMGMLQKPAVDFIMSMLRIGVVAQLFSPTSFDFFYSNFFSFFFEGINQIIALVVTPFNDFDPNSPWFSLDQLLKKLWGMETNAKLWSTLFSNAIGFFFIIAFYLALIIFLIAVVQAVFLYIGTVYAMAVLVGLGPIFITLMLFGKTRELFDEWVDQFVAFAIELIIMFAALGMFAAIIVHFMENYLGYRVCWNTWFSLSLGDFDIIDWKFWLPDIRYDDDHFGPIWGDANNDGIREANEFVLRYFDLPYFDPVFDKTKILSFATEKNFLELLDPLLFIGIVFLMKQFMTYVPTLASHLKGSSAGKSASALGQGVGVAAWKALVGATVGTKGSYKGKEGDAWGWNMGEKTDSQGKKVPRKFSPGNLYYNTLTKGRDGGFLGSSMRSVAGLYDIYNKAAGKEYLAKDLKAAGVEQKPGLLSRFGSGLAGGATSLFNWGSSFFGSKNSKANQDEEANSTGSGGSGFSGGGSGGLGGSGGAPEPRANQANNVFAEMSTGLSAFKSREERIKDNLALMTRQYGDALIGELQRRGGNVDFSDPNAVANAIAQMQAQPIPDATQPAGSGIGLGTRSPLSATPQGTAGTPGILGTPAIPGSSGNTPASVGNTGPTNTSVNPLATAANPVGLDPFATTQNAQTPQIYKGFESLGPITEMQKRVYEAHEFNRVLAAAKADAEQFRATRSNTTDNSRFINMQ